MASGNLHVAAAGKIAPNPDASYMFAYFRNLGKIDFGNCFDTSNVTDMNDMFYGCSSLTSLNLTGFDTSNVTNMAYMFSGCSSLVSLDLTSFNTSNVVTAEYMFAWCRNLTSLDLSSFDSSSPSVVYDIFSGCGRLTNLKCYNSKILELYNNHY